MRSMIFPAAAAAIVLIASGAPGQAATLYESLSPKQMLVLLETEKGSAELDEGDGDGDTTVEGRVDGINYSIYFYECDGKEFTAAAGPNSKCLGFEYRAYFSDYTNDTDTVNAWNNEYHYGSLWRDDDGDLALQLNVIVEGGITDANIRTTFAWWRAVVESFEDFMKERQ